MSLSEFVRTALREKNLTPNDVHKKSRRQISGGYVSDILNEKTTNPTVLKLKALAVGLGVSEELVFRVARGLPLENTENPQHVELIQKYESLSPRRQEEALRMLELLSDLSQGDVAKEKSERSQTVHNSGPQPKRRRITDDRGEIFARNGEPMTEKDEETILRDMELEEEEKRRRETPDEQL